MDKIKSAANLLRVGIILESAPDNKTNQDLN